MCKVTMKQIHLMRRMILEHFTAKEVAEEIGVGVSIVYKYTKAERDLIKRDPSFIPREYRRRC